VNKKILLIEDSRTDAAIVKDLFVREGFEVIIAVSGQDGIREAVNTKPDLILLDVMLPDIDGFTVCSKLKAEKTLKGLIIVMLTIKDSVEDIKKAFQMNADDYVIKPPDLQFLVKKVKLYLGIK
jgi:two-component system alkaline phosphatase synthesis response regulator PhoP